MPYSNKRPLPEKRLLYIREWRRKWYQKNKSKHAARVKEYLKKNPEKKKLWDAEYRNKYREEINARALKYSLKYQSEHRDESKIKARVRRKLFPEKQRASSKKYALKNKHKVYQWARNRAIKQSGVPVGNLKEIVKLRVDSIADVNVCCAYCGVNLFKKPLHLDHFIPISRGGHHVIENIRIACPPCNLQKNDMLFEEWQEYKEKREMEDAA